MKKKLICIFICTLMCATTLSIAGQGAQTTRQQFQSMNSPFIPDQMNGYIPNMLVRINNPNDYIHLPKGIEIAGGKPGQWLDVIIPQTKLHELSEKNIDYSILIADIDRYSDEYRGQYHTLAQMEQILQNLANTYPNITQLTNIGSTYQGRQIKCLEISDNPGIAEGEPGVLYVGLHHAREWPGVEICLTIANKLTTQYGSNATITNLVNNNRIWVIPCENPDGYYYSHDQGIDWRKNRHYFLEYGTYGVDTNRNYPGSSNGDAWGSWGSIGDASVTNQPDNEVYCGPGPASELEVQAIRNMFLNNDIVASISWHTYGELVLWPWGYSSTTTPDNTYLVSIGQQIASRITRDIGSSTYTPQQSVALYPTTGDTNDWVYGYSHYVQGKTTFSYTIEASSDFQPSASKLDQICNENWDGALYLLQQANTIKTTVTSRVLPPIIDAMANDTDGNYRVSWQDQNPAANPDYFQLDELSGLTLPPDNAESGSGLWTLSGFSLSTTKSHSATHSYKGRSQDSDVSTMVTVNPLPVTTGMSLSFWTWYDIENNWDKAFVEVSRDGRAYDLLGSFTGSSSIWINKVYSLSAYAGSSVFIRFRYTTDPMTLGQGFYVDDITPVPQFASVTTVSSSIPTHYYDITGKPVGVYYYRVKGHNTARGWGDFSTIKSINVVQPTNQPPIPPIINGPAKGLKGQPTTYTANASDPENDNVYYMWDWGDGNMSGWLGPYQSGIPVPAIHTWINHGIYTTRVKAKDAHDAESTWSNPLVVRMYKVGDTSGNDVVGFDDINPFVLMLASGEAAYYQAFPDGYFYTGDINLDGQVNFGDINPFVALLSSG